MAYLDLELEVELEIWLGVELGQQVHEAHGPGTGRLEHLAKQVQIKSYTYRYMYLTTMLPTTVYFCSYMHLIRHPIS